MKFNLNKENLYLGFMMFSTVFFIKYILIKPVYIFIFIFIVLGFLNKKYNINSTYLIVSYIFVSYLIFHLVYFRSDPGIILNAILSIMVFPVFYDMFSKISLGTIKIFMSLSIFYLSLEVIWRISNPVYELNDIQLVSETGAGWFYPYKINSFIFTDSNYIALHIFCLICICLLAKLRFQYFLLLILMLLTFSRSGILGTFLATLYFSFNESKFEKIIKPLFYISLISIFLYLIYNISLVSDGSFLSKFFIYNASIYYATNYFTLENYLFGVGLSKTFDLIGIGAHSIWIILLFETGFVGLLIYILYFSVFFTRYYSISRADRNSLFFFLIVFLLMGFSLALYLFPIMVLTIAFILNGNKNVNK